MRVAAKRLWIRIDHYIPAARALDKMSSNRLIGIDETSVKKRDRRMFRGAKGVGVHGAHAELGSAAY